jgi:hypothetical protein
MIPGRIGGNMRKSIATLALTAFVALGLLYTGAMTLAHGYVHVGKTVKTSHGIYHKGYTHTKHGSTYHAGVMYHAY